MSDRNGGETGGNLTEGRAKRRQGLKRSPMCDTLEGRQLLSAGWAGFQVQPVAAQVGSMNPAGAARPGGPHGGHHRAMGVHGFGRHGHSPGIGIATPFAQTPTLAAQNFSAPQSASAMSPAPIVAAPQSAVTPKVASTTPAPAVASQATPAALPTINPGSQGAPFGGPNSPFSQSGQAGMTSPFGGQSGQNAPFGGQNMPFSQGGQGSPFGGQGSPFGGQNMPFSQGGQGMPFGQGGPSSPFGGGMGGQGGPGGMTGMAFGGNGPGTNGGWQTDTGASAQAPSAALQKDFQKLMTDMQAIQDRSQVTPALLAAVRKDNEKLRTESTGQPDQAKLKTLQTDINAVGQNLPSAAQQQTIDTDLKAVIASTGVTDTALIDQTIADMAAVRNAQNVTSDDVATIVADQKAIETDGGPKAPTGALNPGGMGLPGGPGMPGGMGFPGGPIGA